MTFSTAASAAREPSVPTTNVLMCGAYGDLSDRCRVRDGRCPGAAVKGAFARSEQHSARAMQERAAGDDGPLKLVPCGREPWIGRGARSAR
jgi:hypothetical protein